MITGEKNHIELMYEHYCSTPSDINKHLPTLYQYASQCIHITEMGVRNVVSTYAFLMGKPRKLVCYDINESPNINDAILAAKKNGTEMEFNCKDVLTVEIEPTEFLFIDTLHQYSQIKRELELHAGKVTRFIAFHDVHTYGFTPEPADWQTPNIMENYVHNDKGIMPAILEFLNDNPEWRVVYHTLENNGLMVIEKVC